MGFSKREAATVGGVSGLLSLRLLGLALVLPVFTLYGKQLTGNELLVGVAFGAYALAMGLLQIPLGHLSDRVGRKPVIVGGMLVFALGSLAAAWAPTIELLIAARFLQGAGAVSSVALAMVGDVVPPSRRGTAMALVGAPVGMSFSLGIVAGPLLADHLGGVPFLFLLTAGLALVATLFVLVFVREPDTHEEVAVEDTRDVLAVLRDPQALKFASGSLLSDLNMAAFFFLFPLVAPRHGLDPASSWKVLVPMVVAGGLAMFLGSRLADQGRLRGVTASNLLLEAVGLALAWTATSFPVFILGGVLFFAGYSTLEALLPTLATRVAPPGERGATTGLHQTAQSLGGALGAPLAGLLLGSLGLLAGLVVASALAAAFLALRIVLREPATPPHGPASAVEGA